MRRFWLAWLAAATCCLALPLLAQQRRSYAAGAAFEESFGNISISPDACWSGGPASCDQTWSVAAGSGPEIVAAPSGWAGSAVELPPAATALQLTTYGSFPAIPASSGFRLTATVEMSAYDSGYSTILTLRDGAGDSEIKIGDHASGFDEGVGSPCAATAGAVHTLTVVMDGASSTFAIDGVQCGTDFTDPGYAPYELVLDGSTANGIYIQSISIDGAAVTGGWPPSAFVDFAAASGSATAANLAAGTHCGNGTWTVSALTGVTMAYAAGGHTFASPLSVCGTAYANSSDVALELSVATSAGSGGYATYTAQTVGADAVTGYWLSFTVAPTTGYYVDISGVVGNSGAVSALQLQGGTSGIDLCLEESNGTDTTNCTTAPLSQDTWYWVTNGIVDGTDEPAYVYSAAGTLVSSIPCTGCTGFAVGPAPEVELGKIGSETAPGSVTVLYSGVVVCDFDCAYPMPPPAPPARAPCTLDLTGVGVCLLRAPAAADLRRAA